MDAISYSEARSKLAPVMDKVCENHEPLLITRQGGPSVVTISLDDFESIDEKSYLLRSPVNAQRLAESIRRLELGDGITGEIEDIVP